MNFLKSILRFFGIISEEPKVEEPKPRNYELSQHTVEKKPNEDNTNHFLSRLREDLKKDEGIKYEIYLDSEGYLTFGIGHLVRKNDPEYGLPVGTPVSKIRVYQAFQDDFKIAINDAKKLVHWDNLPEEVQLIVANMSFNLGYNRLSKFKKFINAVNNHNWVEAAAEMKDSKWYHQVGHRSKRLHARMLRVS